MVLFAEQPVSQSLSRECIYLWGGREGFAGGAGGWGGVSRDHYHILSTSSFLWQRCSRCLPEQNRGPVLPLIDTLIPSPFAPTPPSLHLISPLAVCGMNALSWHRSVLSLMARQLMASFPPTGCVSDSERLLGYPESSAASLLSPSPLLAHSLIYWRHLGAAAVIYIHVSRLLATSFPRRFFRGPRIGRRQSSYSITGRTPAFLAVGGRNRWKWTGP